jgi:hypothetical protein
MFKLGAAGDGRFSSPKLMDMIERYACLAPYLY